MKLEDKIINILLIIVGLLYFVKMVSEAELATGGYELAVIQMEVARQKAENGDLNEELLNIQSLGYIDKKARSEGFVPAEFIYLP